MAGRGETLHALLGAFPPDAHLGDGNLAAALSIDAVLDGRLDEAAGHVHAARGLAVTAPADRRRLFDVYMALLEVELARRHSDVRRAQQAARDLEAAISAGPRSGERPVPPDYRPLVLINLGIAELWAGRADDARQHLQDALRHARRLPRPFLEVGCLAHLAIAAPLTGQPLPLALELSERALAIAEEHGWTSQSMTSGAFVTTAIGCMRMGRLVEAERHLARAEESLRAGGDPGTHVVVHHARGLLRFGQGRLDEALAAFTRAQDLQRLLAGEHVFSVDARGRALQVRVRSGDAAAVRLALADLSPEQRDRAQMRIALAALELEADNPDQAVEALAPVVDGSAPALSARWSRVEALLLNAAVRDRLGDRRATEESLDASYTSRAENQFVPAELRSSDDRAQYGDFFTEIRDFFDLGVDGLFSDQPDIAVEARAAAAKRTEFHVEPWHPPTAQTRPRTSRHRDSRATGRPGRRGGP